MTARIIVDKMKNNGQSLKIMMAKEDFLLANLLELLVIPSSPFLYTINQPELCVMWQNSYNFIKLEEESIDTRYKVR